MSIRVNGKVIASNGDVKTETDNLVTTDTNQTITATKAFTTQLLRKSTDIDVTSKATSGTFNTLVRFKDKNGKELGAVNNARMDGGNIRTVLEAKNKDGYVPSIGVQAPYECSTGGFGYAPNTPDNAPDNAIVTKDKIANMVTTDTAQTISGVKTFTANTIGNGGASDGTFTIKNDVTDYGTSAVDLVVATSNGKNQLLVHFQEGNKWCAWFDQDSSTKNVTFSMNGCTAVSAPTPAVNANDTQVATTAWVNSKIQLVNELPANSVTGVLYCIPEK